MKDLCPPFRVCSESCGFGTTAQSWLLANSFVKRNHGKPNDELTISCEVFSRSADAAAAAAAATAATADPVAADALVKQIQT